MTFIEEKLKEFEEAFPRTSKIVHFNMDTDKDENPTNWQNSDIGLNLDPIRYRQLKDFLRQALEQQSKKIWETIPNPSYSQIEVNRQLEQQKLAIIEKISAQKQDNQEVSEYYSGYNQAVKEIIKNL